MLVDRHHRIIDYLRIAVTDRCNLRCTYCMPEQGIDYVPRQELLSWEEMIRLVSIFTDIGIRKIRITGGEPLIRKDIIYFLEEISKLPKLEKINITTNGTVTERYLNDLWRCGIRSVNLSLDTLDKEKFFRITRRDEYDKVMQCFYQMLDMGFQVKMNSVIMQGVNEDDIIPFVELTRKLPISVRFIEEMPFNGEGKEAENLGWDYRKILSHIESHFDQVNKLKDPSNSTAYNYQVEGHQGTFGIIAAYSRTFCGTCNRIRLTPKGMIKTCLYDHGIFNIRDLMRAGANDQEIALAIQEAVAGKAKDGYEAENKRGNLSVSESMSTIGG